MKFNFEIDTANAQDLKTLSAVAIALSAVASTENKTASEEVKTEEPVVENVEGSVVEPAPEKPKRARRSKKTTPMIDALCEKLQDGEEPDLTGAFEEAPTEEPVAEETVVEEQPAEEPAGVLPFDEELNPATEELNPATEEKTEEVKVMTLDEWTEVLTAKRDQLGLNAENASLKVKFNELVKSECIKYGADLPKKLSPEQRYKFVSEVFQYIELAERSKSFYVSPF